MRARAFLLGALCAATVTALAMEMLSAQADHRPATTMVTVDRDDTLRALAAIGAQIDDLATLNSQSKDKWARKKMHNRLARLRGDVDIVAEQVRRAPGFDPRYGGGDRDRDRDRYDRDRYDRDRDRDRYDRDRPALMSDADFDRFLASVARASYSSDKLALVQQQVGRAWFTSAQVGQIMDQFAYSSDRVEAAVALWPRIADPENAYTVYDHLSYSSDRDTLRKRLGQ